MIVQVVARRCRIAQLRGFTLPELLTVVAILAILSGLALQSFSGAQGEAEENLVRAELATIRDACHRFRSDMGEPPQCLAELLQAPDPASGLGGWWWREASRQPAAALRRFDPATRRGWNGPYLQPEFVSTDGEEAGESSVGPDGAYVTHHSRDAQSKRLALLMADYQTFAQFQCPMSTTEDICGYGACPAQDVGRCFSNFQLVFCSDDILVRFVRNPYPGIAPEDAVVVAELPLGIRP